jgi:hypothetical protein
MVAFDWVPGILVGALVGVTIGGLAYGVDWGARALWRWLRRPKAGEPR